MTGVFALAKFSSGASCSAPSPADVCASAAIHAPPAIRTRGLNTDFGKAKRESFASRHDAGKLWPAQEVNDFAFLAEGKAQFQSAEDWIVVKREVGRLGGARGRAARVDARGILHKKATSQK